jgi:hypothetical protein
MVAPVFASTDLISGVAHFYAIANNLVQGQRVTIAGSTNLPFLNGQTLPVAGATANEIFFSVAHADVALANDPAVTLTTQQDGITVSIRR